MSMVEIIVLGVALAMDAFAVTISNAFCYRGASRARLFVLPIAFGVFQGLMPLLGFFLGGIIGNIIEAYAGIVTLVILGIIGGNMIKEGVSALRNPEAQRLTVGVILMQSVATSIDAFAVGVSLRAVNVDIALSAAIIALTTCACCFVALALGKRFGNVLGDRAQIVGGVVLVLIGLKAMFF
ncbi:manganese efflux pump MntP family protein [Slackia piriformis]|uniref:manganese efflux pump MntP n=1 Tax=Slackia piriformis TaxID=626934 RepID=UPI0023F062B2|nr:manganese efflux pump MntP family protein [Slackia piriformis]